MNPSDCTSTIHDHKETVRKFCEDRDWDQFHGAKDLAIGLVTEAAELLDHFRFKSEAEILEMFAKSEKKLAISQELADTFFFLLRFAQRFDIDLSSAFAEKVARNGEKYPIEQARGKNLKYTELTQ